jgi:N-acetyl-anhydromuramyl-L-alanine amidase AmpD
MREINRLVVHASATRPGQDIGVREIRRWHKRRGWRDIGYHFVIRRNGVCETGRPVQQIGAHARGFNRDSIGICMVGGIDARGRPMDNFTGAQYRTLLALLKFLVTSHSPSEIVGHRDLPGVNKACPCFDVADWLRAQAMEDAA